MTTKSHSPWFYCSFADDERGGFLGAVIVEASCIQSAANRARSLGINPGGGVLGKQLGTDEVPPEGLRNRLLSHADVDRYEDWLASRRD